MELFDEQEPIIPDLPDAHILYYPRFIAEPEQQLLFDKLYKDTLWRQDDITVFGTTYPQPRLTALYGEEGKPYSYSGITMTPAPFTPLLKELKQRIEDVFDASYSTVLLNLYRHGQDSNGWHSDDEKELGKNPVIASLSLGAVRRFHLKHKKDKTLKYSLDLDPGSLLIMAGTTQHYWKHQLAKTQKQVEPRINLTFRMVLPL